MCRCDRENGPCVCDDDPPSDERDRAVALIADFARCYGRRWLAGVVADLCDEPADDPMEFEDVTDCPF